MNFLKLSIFFLVIFCTLSCAGTPVEVEPLFPSSKKLQSPYGVCAHFTQTFWDQPYHDSIIKALKDAKISNVRFDLWIPYLEPLKDNDQLSIIDGAVRKNLKANLGQLGILFVGWKGQRAWDKETEYVAFFDTLIERYKNEIPYWEVLNEVNETRYSDSISIDSTISRYLPLLQLTYNRLKKANPSIMVTSTGFNDVYDGFIDAMSRSECVKYFDILNFHVYDKPEKLQKRFSKLRGLMDKYQWEKPVWISECGMSTHDENFPKNLISNREIKEEEQACRIPRMYLISFAYGVEKVFTFSIRSREKNNYDKEDHFGILHADITPKPAYNAFRTLINMCPDKSTRPKLLCDDDIYIASWNRPDRKRVYAVWSPDGKKTARIQIRGKFKCYNIFGEKDFLITHI